MPPLPSINLSVFILKYEPFINHRWKVKAVRTAGRTHFWIPRRWSFRCWSHLIISVGISQNWCRTASCETSIHVDEVRDKITALSQKDYNTICLFLQCIFTDQSWAHNILSSFVKKVAKNNTLFLSFNWADYWFVNWEGSQFSKGSKVGDTITSIKLSSDQGI